MKPWERIETARLVLRRPRPQDAPRIFSRYAADPDVTRLLGWPRHRSVESTRAFIEASDAEWSQWPAGPYVVESREDGQLLGGTGFAFEASYRAATGYVFAKDAWGKGYATEALRPLVDLAPRLGIVRLYALCHVENAASWRVLEKCGFVREGLWRAFTLFPNLDAHRPLDVLCYTRVFGSDRPQGVLARATGVVEPER